MSDGRVRYVRNDDVRLAYRVYGDADTTLVWVPTLLSSIDRYDDPTFPWALRWSRCRGRSASSFSTDAERACPTL